MKKIVIHSPGSYDKLKVEEHPDLSPKEDEVLVEVHAAGVNFADTSVRLGLYESAKKFIGWPITPGFEVSGIVKETGLNVKDIKVGQKVICYTLFNGYASQLCVSERQVLPLPENFSLEEGAGFPAVFLTAYHALFQHVVLPKNSTVLIHSAAGGVGTALVQICKILGYKTVGVVGSSHKIKYLKQFEPDFIIDKSKEDLWTKAKEIAPKGYNAVFDANGYTTFQDSYDHLAPMGKLLIYGAHSFLSKNGKLNYFKAIKGLLKTPKFKSFDLITNNKSVVGFNISFLFDQKEQIAECIAGLKSFLKEGKIKPIPVTTVPFDDVGEAHKLIQSGQSVGKIVLVLNH
jgi:NADPH:quinone reductase-like Zn-dependent oxidoreductase